MLILKLLASYLTLGADPPVETDPPAPVVADPPDDDLGLEEDPPADPPARVETTEGDDPAVIREELKAERTRRETAERREREAADRLAAAERTRASPPPAQSNEQRLFEEEEKLLRASDTTELRKWQINSDRTLRASQRMAQNAEMRAIDAADRSEFEALIAREPRLKRFAAEVEKIKGEANAAGMYPKREFLLDIAIGKAVRSAKPKAKPAAAKPATVVERGRPASPRGDVHARAGNSDRDKRRARLEGQIL